MGVSDQEIAVSLAKMGEAFNRRITAATCEVYREACAGAMSAEEWREVVDEALTSCEFWPPPAALLRILRQQREDKADRPLTEAELDAEDARFDRLARRTLRAVRANE